MSLYPLLPESLTHLQEIILCTAAYAARLCRSEQPQSMLLCLEAMAVVSANIVKIPANEKKIQSFYMIDVFRD